MSDIDWGTVPAWFSGVGTTLALLVSLVLLRKTLIERQEELRDKRREQAAKVSAWVWVPGTGGSRCIRVRNSSDAVVYHCFVVYQVIPPGEGPRRGTFVEIPVGPVPPEETIDVEVPNTGSGWSLAGIQFEDAVGRVWVRRERRGLELDFDPLDRWPLGTRFRTRLAQVIPSLCQPIDYPDSVAELQRRWAIEYTPKGRRRRTRG